MSTNAVEFELERRERQGNGNAQDEGPSTLSMTKSGKSSNLDTAGDIGRAAGGAVMGRGSRATWVKPVGSADASPSRLSDWPIEMMNG